MYSFYGRCGLSTWIKVLIDWLIDRAAVVGRFAAERPANSGYWSIAARPVAGAQQQPGALQRMRAVPRCQLT